MASSSSNTLNYVFQNLIAKSALQFPVLAPNKASISSLKKNVCYHEPRNTFGQLWMLKVSNQIIISKLQTTEKVYRWLGAEKDNISLNTQQQLAMYRYSTYNSPIVSLDQVIIKKCNVV
jgi:hypothetical protein